ncbi:dienelactone hydrolase family protein [Sodalis ligni]|uniref:alpha/beta hydrolase n=1 Tax=Sodalis ligni TaxID=2697027 RepID=UPI00193FAD16|nr:dienelactone hydrolase family protein [Sodalis ligni]QWA12805.1 dienelactone hydrolase family protein [Sodalis ligni]
MKRSLIIFLHGVGSNGDSLAPLGEVWRHSLPDTLFAAPNAPMPFDMGPGYQWFSVYGVTPENRTQRVLAARLAFDGLIARIMAEQGMAGHPERVVLVGFSQGSIMALDAIASGRWPVAAVVAFSGRLSSPLPLMPAAATPVLLIHGADDQVIPAWETEHAGKALQETGVAATTFILPRVGHEISAEGVALAGQFISRTFAAVAK